MFWIHPGEGWCTGATVQILIGTADGHVGAGHFQVAGDGASRVGEIPEDKRTGGLDRSTDRTHFTNTGRTIVDVA